MDQNIATSSGGPYFWNVQQVEFRRHDGAISHYGTKLAVAYDATDRILILHGAADAVRSSFVKACTNAIKFERGAEIMADWRLVIFNAGPQSIACLNAVIDGALNRVGFDIEACIADHMPHGMTTISGTSLMANIISDQLAPAMQ